MNRLTSIINETLLHHKTEVELYQQTTDDDVFHAIRNTMRENPNIFWFSHQWCYLRSENKLRFRYSINRERSQIIQKQIDDVVKNDFRVDFVKSLTVLEQVMYVYKWIALYCNYNIHSAHNQTIYSVFVLRHSVCTGIAKAAQYLFKQLNIESKLVFGKVRNSEEDSRHCWLIVNVIGAWYHFDPTFAIPETAKLLLKSEVYPIIGADNLNYNFFCTNDSIIRQSRTIEDEDSLPKCLDSIDYSQYQDIEVFVSRNGETGGLGCILTDSGTTAEIYLAHSSKKYNRLRSVAKVYRYDHNHELLRKEFTIMRKCAGPHLLRASEADFEKGILYIEQATPLSELLSSHYYKLTLSEFCNLLKDIAKGWLELYSQGIIYRDLHLNNIYLSDTQIDNRYIYKLGDFGSCTFVDGNCQYAGLTEQGGLASKWYAAPETWNHGSFDERSAVYGIGMIAYYLLNELLPPLWEKHKEKSFELRISGDVKCLPLPSKLSEDDFGQLQMPFIERSLALDPNSRYDSLETMMADIDDSARLNSGWDNTVIISGSQYKQENMGIQEKFCSTCEINPFIEVSDGGAFIDKNEEVGLDANMESFNDVELVETDLTSKLNEFASTCNMAFETDNIVRLPISKTDSNIESFSPSIRVESSDTIEKPQSKKSDVRYSALSNWFRKHISLVGSLPEKVNSAIFAPAEIQKGEYMMVQVFLYKDCEESAVACKAAEVDPDACQRNYIPLSVSLKNGDKVKVTLKMSGERIEVEDSQQEITWSGYYSDCQFGVYIDKTYKSSTIMGTIILSVNSIPCGRMMFKTKIVEEPQNIFAKIESKNFRKIFISYSHKDESKVKYIAEAYKAQGVDYFFDRHYLKAGDVYPDSIKDYINSADLFILCWSQHAAESDYVQLERHQALSLAYPQKDMQDATLSIHPISIEPHADYPLDMAKIYDFEEV